MKVKGSSTQNVTTPVLTVGGGAAQVTSKITMLSRMSLIFPADMFGLAVSKHQFTMNFKMHLCGEPW